MRRVLSEFDARRLLAGAPVVLVTTRWHGVANVMPAAWNMPLSHDPPLVGIAVHPSRHTYDMLRFSEEFALNVPGRRLMNHVQYLGTVSGRDVQKIELAKLPTFKAQRVDAPLLEGCLAYIECSVLEVLPLGDHHLFVGKVLAAQAEGEAFEEGWLLEDDDYKPLHYLGGELYAILGERRQAQLRTGEEGTVTLEDTAEERERRQQEAEG
ncbi:MAG: flavin reductase family protein [Dehalococcoidia bacterium]|nr:flavin reductase family protein [Dehalococcoidia bacterium]